MRAMHLLNLFLAGCIASSFLGWVAMLSPTTMRVVSVILCSGMVAWGLCWILDDTLITRLHINQLDLQAFLIGSLAMLLIGLGVVLCA